jgi:putative NADH-flavin reductase
MGVKRLIAISAIPLSARELKSPLERLVVHPLLYHFFGGGYDDMKRMETEIEQTDLDWTIFRPTRLTNKAKTGKYRTAINEPLKNAWSISRADVACAMLESVTDRATYKQWIAVAH